MDEKKRERKKKKLSMFMCNDVECGDVERLSHSQVLILYVDVIFELVAIAVV